MKIDNTIEGYGIKLHRLSEDKIEMVRCWRNDPKIRQYMVYQKEITPEQQKEWFSRINNELNLYYIIEYNNEEVGLINLRDINEKPEGEGGIFIYEDKYLNTDLSYRAHILFFDYAFFQLEHVSVRSEILFTNQRAIRFVNFLGGYETHRDENMLYTRIDKDKYLENRNRLRFIKKEELLLQKHSK